MSFLQEEAIKRGLRGVKRKHQLQETFDRQYFYRNPSNKNEIKTITRNYNIIMYIRILKCTFGLNFNY